MRAPTPSKSKSSGVISLADAGKIDMGAPPARQRIEAIGERGGGALAQFQARVLDAELDALVVQEPAVVVVADQAHRLDGEALDPAACRSIAMLQPEPPPWRSTER